MFTDICRPPSLAEIPEEFKAFGGIRYGIGPLSYEQWNQAYDAYLNPGNEYSSDYSAISLVDDHTVESVIRLLKNKYFVGPVLILDRLSQVNIVKLCNAVVENDLFLKDVGCWDLDQLAVDTLLSLQEHHILGKIMSNIPSDEQSMENSPTFVFNLPPQPSFFGGQTGGVGYSESQSSQSMSLSETMEAGQLPGGFLPAQGGFFVEGSRTDDNNLEIDNSGKRKRGPLYEETMDEDEQNFSRGS